MAEPLKNEYSPDFIRRLAELASRAEPAFDAAGFEHAVLDEAWELMELKARTRRVSQLLGQYLPADYGRALDILYTIEGEFRGLPHLVFPDFVEQHGVAPEHWERSIEALQRFTRNSTAEFAVRPFLIREPERMLRQMAIWAEDESEHVRRLASEGCRPRLPWAQALPVFKKDPAPLLPILEKLRQDESLYVRKSVANNLNDIAKDHPGLVIETARRWQGTHPHTDWIIRHGCRTLIRAAHPDVMSLFGYADSVEGELLADVLAWEVSPDRIAVGGQTELSYRLRVRGGEPMRLRIEYGIDFVKASGKVSRKLFLLTDKTSAGGSLVEGTRTHRWADLSTRKHYPGTHRVVLVINGRETASALLQLEPAADSLHS
ncbi:DNA alkylation repair protein [Paenibacillus tarimensis]|uniref:DNA alkylation repair protein n=1 Tax=Paenibacillus tarimensis TaxID=416012 RepID=UPI001F38FCA6|nr:DNA alkylation repair protein [Paenibacillus tarimensis]MCF2943407.1 DNA alkylation repair protein [Paenibacillus tarimensis]